MARPTGPGPASGGGAARADRAVLWLFTASIFLSAFLLFLVQPMFSKMVLPLLGGTPAVWNTCMLFFQAALLGGYLYAHLGSKWLGVRKHALAHLVLLGAAFATLPIHLPGGRVPAAETSPVPWLLGTLTISLGLPFFAISASGPLLQKWFSETGHPDAANPYFLYAASNVGSLLALLGYPLLVEPRLRLAAQSGWWTAGYVALFALFVGCASIVWRFWSRRPSAARESMQGSAGGEELSGPRGNRSAAITSVSGIAGDLSSSDTRSNPIEDSPPDLRQRLIWIALAFVPSSLLLGVTGYLTTDVAAVPLLWILPLALYLLTFVLVFARRRLISDQIVLRAQPSLGLFTLLTIAWAATGPAWLLYPLHLIAFFVLAMVAHGELARRRPSPVHLTEFYLWMSFGGVMGGVFNVLVAPHLFDSMLEYPLMVALACAIRPPGTGTEVLTAQGKRSLVFVTVLFLAVLIAGLFIVEEPEPFLVRTVPASFLLGGVAVVRNRKLFAVAAIGLFLVVATRDLWFRSVLYAERTFFAVHRVMVDPTGEFYRYGHGTTVHGVQSRDPLNRTRPLGYYSVAGPVGSLMASLPARQGRNIAVVGLGTGAMACHRSAGERWTFYEIDPAVDRIARDLGYFTYLADCAPDAVTILGDARITLGEAETEAYDLIFLDAFSSDAIPAHLLTREALQLYLSKVATEGMVVFHISNRHLDLEPMLAAVAADADLVALVGEHVPPEDLLALEVFASRWVAMGRPGAAMAALRSHEMWREARMRKGVDLWTDDFSNVLSVVSW